MARHIQTSSNSYSGYIHVSNLLRIKKYIVWQILQQSSQEDQINLMVLYFKEALKYFNNDSFYFAIKLRSTLLRK